MRWVVFSNVYVACCGAALTAATYPLFGLPPRLDAVALLVFCCTLVVYNLDRLVEPTPGDSAMERWVEQRRAALWALVVVATIGAIAITPWLGRDVLLSLPIAGLFALGYCLPILPSRSHGWRRLKALPGAKLVLIAGVWAYATAGLPMLQAGVALDRSSLAVLLTRLLFLAAVALPFDVPDMHRDRQSGIATLPTWLGPGATRWIAIGLALAAAAGTTLGNPWPAAGAVLTSLGITTALLLAMRPGRGVVYYMIALDGMLLVQAGILVVVAMLS